MQSITFKKRFKAFENVEWSNSLLRHFKIQPLLKINCCMAAISAFRVMQHSQIFIFFRNRIQYIALYQLHNSLTSAQLMLWLLQAMFTLYRIGFCSVSKVAPVQCEQDLMFCCGAEIVPKHSQCEQNPIRYAICKAHF